MTMVEGTTLLVVGLTCLQKSFAELKDHAWQGHLQSMECVRNWKLNP